MLQCLTFIQRLRRKSIDKHLTIGGASCYTLCMSVNRHRPIYNLKAVVRETGLKPDTLRAWERRYGVPAPQRTHSGHRLYSQHDIDLLRWLIARQAEGLSISRAVELWQRMQADEPGDLHSAGAGHPPNPAPVPAPVASASPAAADVLRDAWVDACLRFDEQSAEHLLAQAFALLPPEVVALEVIAAGLARLGEGWYRGSVTVQQEHFASELAMRRMEAMLAATPAPTRPGRIVIGCPPDEAHIFVPLLLTLLLRRRGWNVVYLGANVPLVSMEVTVAATRPSLVVLTAQQLHTAATLLEVGELLLRERVPLAYGGLIFNRLPALRSVIPGAFLGDRLDQAASTIERLMANARVQAAQHATGPELREALHHFQEARADVESAVAHRLRHAGYSGRMLAAANDNMGRNIAAALALGSMEHMGPDLDWIEGLLVHHAGLPASHLDDYLEAYLSALRSVLGNRVAPVTDYLTALTGFEEFRQFGL